MTEETKAPEEAKPAPKAKAPRKPRAAAAPKPAKKTVADLTAEDLVDQKDGSPRPLSAITTNLQATVKGDLGRALLTLAQKDYIGQEPIVILAVDAAELREIADALDEAAAARLAEEA